MGRKIGVLLGFLVVTLGAGFFGSLFTRPAIPGWYATLQKPEWNPPSWVFAPVWTTLYVLIAISAWLVWQKGATTKAWAWFWTQMVLNVAWSWVFFGLKQPGWATLEVLLLWAAIAGTIASFAKVSRPAAWLLAPYLGWVSFASVLTFTIWRLNG